jgi:hypothetical protein
MSGELKLVMPFGLLRYLVAEPLRLLATQDSAAVPKISRQQDGCELYANDLNWAVLGREAS